MSEINILDAVLGEIENIPIINVEMSNPIYRGPAGRDGADGRDYVLTQADKQEIADMVDIPDGDLSDYATIQYVDNAIANIDIPEIDLSDYPTREEVSGLIPDVDLSDYATIQYIDEAILAIPKPDLSDYATIDQVNEAILAIPKPDLSPYQTAEQVETAINNALSSIGVAEAGEY